MTDRAGSTFFIPPPEVKVPLFWVGMGEEIQRTPDYRWHGLKRETQAHLLWQFTLRGEGMIETGNYPTLALHRGEGFLARIPSNHCYYYRPGSSAWRFIWVIWSGPAIGEIADALMGRSAVRLVRMHPEIPEMRALRSLIRVGAVGDPWRNSAEAYRLLLRVGQASTERPARSQKGTRTIAIAEKLFRREPSAAIGKRGSPPESDSPASSFTAR